MKQGLRLSQSSQVDDFLKDVRVLSSLRVSKKYEELHLEEYPFDQQLLTLSKLYRKSRSSYLDLGGTYLHRVSSTMRSLSTHDLFKNEIEFSPLATELLWFKDNLSDVADPLEQVDALLRFSEISLFHEQNHRVVWRLLPPASNDGRQVTRYLNFAESLVATLDVALGDEIGKKLSPVFERLKVIYRVGDEKKLKLGRARYRRYLLAVLCATYLALEMVHNDDILKAVNYILPGQKKTNRDAVRRGLELSELFTRVTNPLWQERHWRSARNKLAEIHRGSRSEPLILPADPLDLEDELSIAERVFIHYGL